MCEFAHLHCHSAFSFHDGLAPVTELVARAAELNQPGIALTDHGHVHGAAQFAAACGEYGLKGVLGMEAYEAVPHTWDPERDSVIFKQPYDPAKPRYYHLTLWVLNEIGWLNMCALHTQSFLSDYKPKNQPLLDRATLERHSEGLAVGLGCIASRTNQTLRARGDAYEAAKWYAEVFEGRVFCEVMAVLPEQQAMLRDQRKLASRLGIPVIATNDVHYVHRSDGVEGGPHHVLVQARRWKKKSGAESSSDKSDAGYGRWYGADGFYLKSYEDMLATGGLMPAEIHATMDVLGLVDFDFTKLARPEPPVAPVPEPGVDPDFDAFLAASAI